MYFENSFKGNNIGNTTLTVNYQGHSLEVPVVVYAGDDTIDDIPTLSNLEYESKKVNTKIDIYPNPNDGNFKFLLKDNITNNIKLELFNSIGQEIIISEDQYSTIDGVVTVSLKGIKSGIYYIKLYSNLGYKVGKVMLY